MAMSELKQKLLLYELAKLGFPDAVYVPASDQIRIQPDNDRMPKINNAGDISYGKEYDSFAVNTLRPIVDGINEAIAAWDKSKAMPLDDLKQYRILAEYNNILFAARDDTVYDRGFHFVTWQYNYDKTGVDHGHYTENYNAAKEDFAGRSGLIPATKLFTPEQAAEIKASIAFRIENDGDITYTTENELNSIATRLRAAFPDKKNNSTEQKIDERQNQEPQAATIPISKMINGSALKQIELENWVELPDKPNVSGYDGQRKAQEIFAELKHRLEIVGMLPDEYFSLDSQWENGREIPKDAVIFSTVQYGASEGIYLDVSISWNEENKKNIKSFATGKTLGESESDLDRMYLTASAVNKAFYSNEPHARYFVVGGEDKPLDGAVLHLNGAERQLLIESLIETRNNQQHDATAVERLLCRVVGDITGFVNDVGARPLQVSDYDMAVLAIQNGNLAVFNEAYKKLPDKMDDLLIYAAARPGKVGLNMTSTLLQEATGISNEAYLTACKNAVAVSDTAKVLLLADRAAVCVADLDMSLYGKIISVAINENKPIARDLVKQCTPEQIQAANPYILAQALFSRDIQLAYAMAEKKINVTHSASDLIHALKYDNNDYLLKILYDKGMEMYPKNIPAMLACIKVKSVEMGQVLIDRGMNFEQFEQFAVNNHNVCLSSETFIALKQYADKPVTPEKPKTLEEKMNAAKEKVKAQDAQGNNDKSRKREERE